MTRHSQDADEAVELNGKKIRFPLTTVVSIVGLAALAVGLWYKVDSRLQRIESGIESSAARLEDHIRGDWTMANQEPWSIELARRNPNINVPKAREFFHPNETDGPQTR